MQIVDILKWAAGAPQKLPAFAGVHDERLLALLDIDEEELLSLIGWHRLTNRFLARYRKEYPAWCSQALLGRLLQQDVQEQQHLKRQLQAMQELAQAMADQPYPPILIKGFSTAALTGQSSHWHGSVDLDIFHCDPEALLETLERLGFRGNRHTLHFDELGTLSCEQFRETAPLVNGEHEFGSAQRGDVRIELHRYFPACSYPPGIRQADLKPAWHPGCWVQTYGDLVGRGLLYRDLWEHRTWGVTPETRSLVVPNAALSVFLRCIHMFLHYIRITDIISPTKQVLALKLIELAEIRDLAEHPHFDKSQFLRLVSTFGGQDAVDFASYLLHAYFGSHALLFASSPSLLQTSFHFPQCLILWRCWATYTTPDQLLLPASLDSVIERLQPNRIQTASAGEPQTYTVFAPGDGQPLERVLFHTVEGRGRTIPLRLSVTYASGQICFEVTFLQPLQDEDHCYRLDILGTCTATGHYLSAVARTDPVWQVAAAPSASQPGDRYTTRHCFAWSTPGKPVLVLLLIGLQNKHKPAWFAFDPLLAVPLKIRMKDE